MFLNFTYMSHILSILNIPTLALAAVTKWLEHWPVYQRVSGSIPSQGPRTWVAGWILALGGANAGGGWSVCLISMVLSPPSCLPLSKDRWETTLGRGLTETRSPEPEGWADPRR